MEELTLTPAQEFREARGWLARHKRDPFLWLVILLPLTYAVLTVAVPTILMTVFPFSEAKRALGQDLPSANIIRVSTLCNLLSATIWVSAVYAETWFTVDGFSRIDERNVKTSHLSASCGGALGF